MNCNQFDKLIDAFVDGDLSGSLRLEFESHRVHCPACRQQLALFQAAEQVIATAPTSASVSIDFSDRVMAEIASQSGDVAVTNRDRSIDRGRFWGWSLIAAGGLQAAAALLFAIGVWGRPSNPSAEVLVRQPIESTNTAANDEAFVGPPAIARANSAYPEEFDEIDLRERYYALIVEKFANVRASVASDIHALAQYPYELTAASSGETTGMPSETNPLFLFFDALVPAAAETEPLGENGYSL